MTDVTEKLLVLELSLQNHFGKQYFIVSEPNEKSLAPKLTDWRPFQIQMAVAGSIFEPHLSSFGNQPMHLLKLVK